MNSEFTYWFDSAPHFCRDGHVPIRFWDDTELCPLCRVLSSLEDIGDYLEIYRDSEDISKGVRDIIYREFEYLQHGKT